MKFGLSVVVELSPKFVPIRSWLPLKPVRLHQPDGPHPDRFLWTPRAEVAHIPKKIGRDFSKEAAHAHLDHIDRRTARGRGLCDNPAQRRPKPHLLLQASARPAGGAARWRRRRSLARVEMAPRPRS